MSLIKIEISGTDVGEPTNWKDVETSISKSQDLGGVVFEYIDTLTFDGFGYNFLYEKFSDSVCNTLPVIIYLRQSDSEAFTKYFSGLIFLSVGSNIIFNRTRRRVDIKITDDTFQAKINNNKGIKTDISVPKSKNEVEIDRGSFVRVNIYNSSNSLVRTIFCYDLFGVFKYMVSFLSDGTMTFESNFLSEVKYAITRGTVLRGENQGHPSISFQELFDTCRKLFNIGFVIDGNKLIIEREQDFFDQEVSVEVDAVTDLLEYADETKIYSNIVIGDSNYEDGIFPGVSFYDTKQENYLMKGVCNTDNELNLESGSFIYNSNSIAKAVGGDDSSDDESFILEINQDTLASYRTTQINYFGSGDFFYNPSLTNIEVIKRWMPTLPQVAAIYSDTSPSEFYVGRNSFVLSDQNGVAFLNIFNKTTGQKLFEYNLFGQDYYKTIINELGNPVEYRYFTTPIIGLSIGDEISIRGEILNVSNPSERIPVNFSGGLDFPFNKTIDQSNGWGIPSREWTVPASGYFTFEIGVRFANFGENGVDLYFKTLTTDTGSGEIGIGNDQEDFSQVKINETTAFISYDQFLAIRNGKTKKIKINASDNISVEGWLNNVSYHNFTGMAEIKISKNESNT